MTHKPLADLYGHNGVEYGVFEVSPGMWEWKYYPKVGEGEAKSGRIQGDRHDAIAACKAAIDDWRG